MSDTLMETEEELMSEHRHSFVQRFERSIPSCTVKVWECPCGAWNIRHFGCHNQGHDQDVLATIAALQAALKEAQEELGAYRQEFTVKLDDGRPYVMDALEAGQMLADAQAEARMAIQDRDEAQRAQARGKAALQSAPLPASEGDDVEERMARYRKWFGGGRVEALSGTSWPDVVVRARDALEAGLTLQCGSSDDAHNTYVTGPEKGKHTEDCPGCMMEAAYEELKEEDHAKD